MSDKVRQSQMASIFGPGAMVDLPGSSVIIGGLEGWQYDTQAPSPDISEPRLVEKLRGIMGVPHLILKRPPASNERGIGFRPTVRCYKFPNWFVVQRTDTTPQGFRRRRLVMGLALEKGTFKDNDGKKMSVVPMRFVRSCTKGHVDDIDWDYYVHRGELCGRKEFWIEERGTSGEISDIYIACSCGRSQSLSIAAQRGSGVLGICPGERPWLGPHSREDCDQMSRLLIRTASNAYFPQTIPVISIPEAKSPVEEAVRSVWDNYLAAVPSKELLAAFRNMPQVAAALTGFTDDEVWSAICAIRSGNKTGESAAIKDVEFEALLASKPEIGENKPEGDFYARAYDRAFWDAPWMAGIQRVVLVHRLREVVALLGFTRLEPVSPDVHGELDLDVQRAAVARELSWLPGYENRGEGIFLQFDPEALAAWAKRPEVRLRGQSLLAGYSRWAAGDQKKLSRFPGITYYMLHSFSHLLMGAIALECGYPAASLRERVYVAADPTMAQGGVLIYTGSSDADGTLGGLIQAGRDIRRHVRVALESGKLCSNDPVCSHHDSNTHDPSPLTGAACHGCLYVSETSCEQRNVYLDRALVIETVGAAGAEFFTGV